MKAVVFHAVGDIRLDDVPEPRVEVPTDAVVRLTASAICGTDLHLVRGTVAGMRPGTVIGHEGVGIVVQTGADVCNHLPGDRVVIPSTIACGSCAYCLAGYFSQCDHANPNGPAAGTAFYGGPIESGPFQGLQAELARIPFASVNLVKLPREITDDQAITLSDIFPTGYFGAVLAEVRPGDTVAVFGCGPVGQFAIASAFHLGASRVLAIDCVETRLHAARTQGAEVIHFEREDPVDTIHRLTDGIGVDRAIDAVGVDASHAHQGPAAIAAQELRREFDTELAHVAPERGDHRDHRSHRDPRQLFWHPGDAPSQVLRWAVQGLAKAGSLGIVGVYPQQLTVFPIGAAMNKNLTLKMGNCNHRKYIPHLLELIRTGAIDPTQVITQHEPLVDAVEAYQAFDRRQSGWLKVKLEPQSGGAGGGDEAAA